MSENSLVRSDGLSTLNIIKLLAEDARKSLAESIALRDANAYLMKISKSDTLNDIVIIHRNIIRKYDEILDALYEIGDTSGATDLRVAVEALVAEHRPLGEMLREAEIKIGSQKEEFVRDVRPPAIGEFITRLTTKTSIADMVLDSRAEAFGRNILRVGVDRALLYYWADTIRSCGPGLRGLARLIWEGALRLWSGH